MQSPSLLDYRRLHFGLAFALMGLLGCGMADEAASLATSTPKSPVVTSAEAELAEENPLPDPIPVEAGGEPWIDVSLLPWEAWYLQYLDGKCIGYSKVVVDKSALERDVKNIRIHRTDCVETTTAGNKSRFKREVDALEASDGTLIEMNESTHTAEMHAETVGKFVKNEFSISTKTTTADETKSVASKRIPWKKGTWGLMGLQAILIKRPPQPGELLKGQVYVPQLAGIADVELLAGQPDTTPLPSGSSQTLLPVDAMVWIDDDGMRTRNWINEQGEVLKTISLTGPNLSTFWVPAELGQRTHDEFLLDEMLSRRVALSGDAIAPDAREARFVVERDAAADGQDVYALLAKTATQQVISTSALSATVTVQVADLEAASPVSESEAVPAEACRTASKLVPSDAPMIAELARKWLEETPDVDAPPSPEAVAPWVVARRLAGATHRHMSDKPLDRQVMAPLQTVQNLSGDCVEQAILLTALLRSQDIPARVAAGLALDPEATNQMRFHMWTEAWLADRWIALDATTGRVAGADRLKMLDSCLESQNPYDAILPIFEGMNGLAVRRLP